MDLTFAAALDFASRFLWSLLRVGAFVMAAPIFGARSVPARVKIALAVALAALVAPLLGPVPMLSGFDISWAGVIGEQVLLGAALGFATHLFFQLFATAGQFTAMQTGLGFASLVDPSNGVSVAVLGQFYLMLATVTFVSLDGHLVLIGVLVDSFTVVPVDAGGDLYMVFWRLVNFGGWMFAGAFVLALPAVASLLLVNLAFGVMTRAAPQLNVFTLGFPIALCMGLVVLWIVLADWLAQFGGAFSEFVVILKRLLV